MHKILWCLYHSNEAPTEEHLSSSIDFFGFYKNKFDFFGHFFFPWPLLGMTRVRPHFVSLLVRIFSFSFKLSLICFFFCGQGPVIKINSNQRYATTAVSSSIIRVIAESGDSNVPLQVQYIQQNRSLDCILSSACTKHAQGGWGWGLLPYMSYIVCAAVEGMVSTVVWNCE